MIDNDANSSGGTGSPDHAARGGAETTAHLQPKVFRTTSQLGKSDGKELAAGGTDVSRQRIRYNEFDGFGWHRVYPVASGSSVLPGGNEVLHWQPLAEGGRVDGGTFQDAASRDASLLPSQPIQLDATNPQQQHPAQTHLDAP